MIRAILRHEGDRPGKLSKGLLLSLLGGKDLKAPREGLGDRLRVGLAGNHAGPSLHSRIDVSARPKQLSQTQPGSGRVRFHDQRPLQLIQSCAELRSGRTQAIQFLSASFRIVGCGCPWKDQAYPDGRKDHDCPSCEPDVPPW